MTRQPLIVFDYDGTLHHSLPLYRSALEQVMQEMNALGLNPQGVLTERKITRWLGMTPDQMWREFMPGLDPDLQRRFSRDIGQWMVRKTGQLGGLYDDVEETLLVLRNRGWRLMILSNAKQAYLDAHRQTFGLDRFFDGYLAAEAFGYLPKWKIYRNIERNEAVTQLVVGDRLDDVIAGVRNGVPVVGCGYGYGDRLELYGANIRIEQFSELLDLTENFSQ